jgi:hypothetical protein
VPRFELVPSEIVVISCSSDPATEEIASALAERLDAPFERIHAERGRLLRIAHLLKLWWGGTSAGARARGADLAVMVVGPDAADRPLRTWLGTNRVPSRTIAICVAHPVADPSRHFRTIEEALGYPLSAATVVRHPAAPGEAEDVLDRILDDVRGSFPLEGPTGADGGAVYRAASWPEHERRLDLHPLP